VNVERIARGCLGWERIARGCLGWEELSRWEKGAVVWLRVEGSYVYPDGEDSTADEATGSRGRHCGDGETRAWVAAETQWRQRHVGSG
jgi:hypothetical protein